MADATDEYPEGWEPAKYGFYKRDLGAIELSVGTTNGKIHYSTSPQVVEATGFDSKPEAARACEEALARALRQCLSELDVI